MQNNKPKRYKKRDYLAKIYCLEYELATTKLALTLAIRSNTDDIELDGVCSIVAVADDILDKKVADTTAFFLRKAEERINNEE